MPASLLQIQARLEQATALRDDASETVQVLALGGEGIDVIMRQRHISKLQGYQREVTVLQKIERDIISQGRAAENDLRVLSVFGALDATSALLSACLPSDAQMTPRETPRNDAGIPPLPKIELGFVPARLPSAGDVF